MDKVAFGMQIQTLLDTDNVDVSAALKLIAEQLGEDAKSAIRAFATLTEVVVGKKLLAGAVDCVAFYAAHSAQLTGVDLAQMREVVRRSAATSEEKLFVDSIGLNTAIATAIVKRLRVLMALRPGVYVCSQSWGFGCVQGIDAFYGKVIIDFQTKKGHAMSLTVAGQNLEIADENHLMTRYFKDPETITTMAKKHPAELTRLAIASYGPMPVQRLADRLAEVGLVAPADWKGFWDAARRGLKADKAHPVEIPTKRTEPIRLLECEEDYGDRWLNRFARERDIKAIYTQTLELLTEKKGELPDGYRDTVAARLNFALKGADRVDYARYAQIAMLLAKLELSTPEERAVQVETLLDGDEEDNLLQAMRGLSARDVGSLVGFTLAVKPEAKAMFLERLPQMNSVALTATLKALAGDDETGAAVRSLLCRTTTPVTTLVVWALRNRDEAQAWKVPGLPELVMQAIHIIEQRHTGENLKMRNALQAFFDSARWLEELCKTLSAFDRKVIFERIQASSAWETSSQRNVLVRMARFDPALASLRRTVKAQQEHQHLTSRRSLEAFKLAYDHLINVEIPANTKDIATARSYGDLRENAEYQFAKEHQHVLLSKQDEMDRTLRMLKVTDFSEVSCDTVGLGTQVTVNTAAGESLTYSILGELDRDESLNIISCRSRLAQALLGKRVGDIAELPGERKTVDATVTAISPLSDAVRAWLAQIPTEYTAD